MTSILHSPPHPHASTQGAACLPAPEPEACAPVAWAGLGAGATPRGGSIGRRGAADEFEGPHHGRGPKNLDPYRNPLADIEDWRAARQAERAARKKPRPVDFPSQYTAIAEAIKFGGWLDA